MKRDLELGGGLSAADPCRVSQVDARSGQTGAYPPLLGMPFSTCGLCWPGWGSSCPPAKGKESESEVGQGLHLRGTRTAISSARASPSRTASRTSARQLRIDKSPALREYSRASTPSSIAARSLPAVPSSRATTVDDLATQIHWQRSVKADQRR
jgi:hypothetical protein